VGIAGQHRAKIFGRCEAKTDIKPFGRIVDQTMNVETYTSAQRLFWVVEQRIEPLRPSRKRPAQRALAQRQYGATPRLRHLAQPSIEIYNSQLRSKST
jgi:hypothetical protein